MREGSEVPVVSALSGCVWGELVEVVMMVVDGSSGSGCHFRHLFPRVETFTTVAATSTAEGRERWRKWSELVALST